MKYFQVYAAIILVVIIWRISARDASHIIEQRDPPNNLAAVGAESRQANARELELWNRAVKFKNRNLVQSVTNASAMSVAAADFAEDGTVDWLMGYDFG